MCQLKIPNKPGTLGGGGGGGAKLCPFPHGYCEFDDDDTFHGFKRELEAS